MDQKTRSSGRSLLSRNVEAYEINIDMNAIYGEPAKK